VHAVPHADARGALGTCVASAAGRVHRRPEAETLGGKSLPFKDLRPRV
jgi:hypothetical protein